jgi:hypothetical protein
LIKAERTWTEKKYIKENNLIKHGTEGRDGTAVLKRKIFYVEEVK